MNYPQFTPPQQTSLTGQSIGYGLLGCGGGLLLGLLGGGVLLIVLSLILAVNATVTPPPFTSPDLALTLNENLLNRVAQSSMDEAARVDLLPGNQFRVIIDTQFSVLGTVVPIQVTGLFDLQLVENSLRVNLIDTQVAGLDLPPELADVFSADLPALNQEINQALQELLTGLGTPITITSLTTTDTELRLEARQSP